MGGVRIERGAPFGSGSRRELGSNMRGGKTHRRNTGPMLSSPRCGARTRSGKPCRSPAVPAPSSIGQALSPSRPFNQGPKLLACLLGLRIFFSSGCSLGPTAPTESPLLLLQFRQGASQPLFPASLRLHLAVGRHIRPVRQWRLCGFTLTRENTASGDKGVIATLFPSSNQ